VAAGGGADPTVARLRAALDELTAGAEPNGARVAAIEPRRTRRWLVPALAAAAAVAVIVGVATAVVGRDGTTTPAAPTPTGPPVAPAPLIPWYELRLDDGSSSPPTSIGAGISGQVWATPDYSRVLIAHVAATPNAATAPTDWPVVEPIADVPVGVAWSFRGDEPDAVWHGVYWAPDDDTSVILTGSGFSAAELAGLLPALSVGPDTTVISSLSSLVPLPFGAGSLFAGHHPLESRGFEPAIATVYVSDGVGVPLAMNAPNATSIGPMTTPFGEGFRMDIAGTSEQGGSLAQVWWPVDGGPFWAGLAAPSDRIDELLDHLVRVEDVAAPAPGAPPAPDPPTAPATTVAVCGWAMNAPSPHALATAPPQPGLPATTTTTTTTAVPPCDVPPMTTIAVDPGPHPTTTTTAVETVGTVTTTTAVEPAMTAVAPASFPGEGFKPPVAVGESVMLSAAQSVGEAGITVYAQEAIQASGVVDELERLRSIDAFGDVVIIQAGTNGTVTAEDLDRMMAAVSDVERVVVMTVHADRSWIAPNNDLIRALPDRYPNVVVLDWDLIATTCDCLAGDGIHVEDRAVYAEAISEASGLR
jgi:hypothetical protein